MAIALVTLPSWAQVTGPTRPARPLVKPIQVNVEMVLVNVAVTDFEDRLVLGLHKDNFRLFENEVEQEILTFSQEDSPMSIGLLFDLSTSMADKIDKARQAALQILKMANPADEFFLVSFSDRAELTSGFTPDLQEVQSRMLAMVPRGHTALLDAIHMGTEEMKNARYRRRALLVISDGGDNHSRYNEKRIRSELKEADCQLYAMGIYDERDMRKTEEERKGPALLSDLADITGGRAFRVSNLEELPEVAAKINMELRDEYVLGYKPIGQHNGAWRNIKVKVDASASEAPIHVYNRSGYYSRID